MKIKAGVFGGMLLLAAATAYGLDMRSAPPGPASAPQISAAPQQSQTAANVPLPDTDALRQKLTASGIDPDSEKGQIMMHWLAKIMRDPAWQAALKGQLFKQGTFGATPLSSNDRLRVLRLMKDMVGGSENDCRMLEAGGSDFIAIAKTSSPRTLEDMLDIMDIMVTSASSEHVDERYSIVELLDAEARLNATPPPSGFHQYPTGKCAFLAFAINAIDALPEPARQRESFEFFRRMSHSKSAVQTVLDDPFAYLDEAFDERRLPDVIRHSLPADGSHPLPYSRLTVDAQWVNKTTPGDNAAFKDVFTNRRNNGVIAEVTNSAGWSDFALSYGIASLRTQTVADGTALSQLGTLSGDTAIVLANRVLVPGESIDIPVPQPSIKGEKARRCEVGQSVPASTIFHSLKGEAVSLQCTEVGKSGKTPRWHASWLPDYGIMWTDTIDDEDGRTEAVIRNITIEGAPQ